MISTSKIYVDQSPVHGWGVFAKQDIKSGELIEECPVLTLPILKGDVTPLMIDYRFNWPQGDEWQEQVMALGYGSLYNHSETPNAAWISSDTRKCFIFYATRDIKEDEEIFIWYGNENYWNDGRTHTNVV